MIFVKFNNNTNIQKLNDDDDDDDDDFESIKRLFSSSISSSHFLFSSVF